MPSFSRRRNTGAGAKGQFLHSPAPDALDNPDFPRRSQIWVRATSGRLQSDLQKLWRRSRSRRGKASCTKRGNHRRTLIQVTASWTKRSITTTRAAAAYISPQALQVPRHFSVQSVAGAFVSSTDLLRAFSLAQRNPTRGGPLATIGAASPCGRLFTDTRSTASHKSGLQKQMQPSKTA